MDCGTMDFNPRTPCGVRRHGGRLRQRHGDFNPRTPCGVRHGVHWFAPFLDAISIHAPLAGCDAIGAIVRQRAAAISIHAPLAGCDHASQTGHGGICHFNPRTPCGVRHRVRMTVFKRWLISIHAPLAGCDIMRTLAMRGQAIFQSTHPLRGATFMAQRTAPQGKGISIHAPLAGCDRAPWTYHNPTGYFNPRTPCGVRRERDGSIVLHHIAISIHAPLAGCDTTPADRQALTAYFNPRTPCGVRRRFCPRRCRGPLISIHAPLAGCDTLTVNSVAGTASDFNPRTPCGVRPADQRCPPPMGDVFQSTHPLRGATIMPSHKGIVHEISIHAPLAGCDTAA